MSTVTEPVAGAIPAAVTELGVPKGKRVSIKEKVRRKLQKLLETRYLEGRATIESRAQMLRKGDSAIKGRRITYTITADDLNKNNLEGAKAGDVIRGRVILAVRSLRRK